MRHCSEYVVISREETDRAFRRTSRCLPAEAVKDDIQQTCDKSVCNRIITEIHFQRAVDAYAFPLTGAFKQVTS